MNGLAEQFLLDPDVHYLNNGAFGATPKPVLEAYRQWQIRMERQPTQFYLSELREHFAQARKQLALLVGADHGDLAFVPNATFGVNLVARAMNFGPGDVVLGTDHEYGACDRTWQFLSQKQGFEYERRHISLPMSDPQTVAQDFLAGVTPKTKLIFISHITSPTAVTLPIAEICRQARELGILTLVDGAHTVGQIDLDLNALGADFYTSNAHKWLCAPKTSAFLHVHTRSQHLVEPLVVSWGWGEGRAIPFGSDFLDLMQWPGTWNTAAYLAVPEAIEFQRRHHWPEVRKEAHRLLTVVLSDLAELEGVESIYHSHLDYAQMGAILLPKVDPSSLHDRLLNEYRIEVPVHQWNDRQLLRISVQGYNTQEDLTAIKTAIIDIF